MRQLLLAAIFFAIPASIAAQHIGVSHFSGRTNFSPGRSERRGYGRAYYPLGLFDPYYSDYLSSTGYPVASQPPLILLESTPRESASESPSATSRPLMIELRGDRYIQIDGEESSRSQMIDRPIDTGPARRNASIDAASQSAPTTAVLIFRDGQRQEVSAYTIADGAIYASSDYASTGVWNQKFALTSLNVSETIAANNSRNVRFQLPSAPNEVIIGP